MSRVTIDGIEIDYRLLGEGDAPVMVLTPGGRFAKESPGVPELAEQLVAGGRRVLLWDRPNCGASDISFDGPSESQLQADVLIRLIRQLELGPVALGGGSAGSRVSMIAAAQAPEQVSHLLLWWISGGPLSLISLAYYYCFTSAMAASHGGMAAVAALPDWAEPLKRNPRNRDILLRQDPARFIETMERWAIAFLPTAESPVPGMTATDFKRLTMPTRIYRSGTSDLSHTRKTSEEVHALIAGSELVDPPWPDDDWNRRSAEAARTGSGHFAGWPALAPEILEFTAK